MGTAETIKQESLNEASDDNQTKYLISSPGSENYRVAGVICQITYKGKQQFGAIECD